ncbi:MAG: hypothetical protein HIU92_18410 [Proteobacteria bacterium]|nr:hypothetical protein [Pseudomonadota bacterium]
MKRPPFRQTLLGACLAAPFLLAGCSSDQGVPQNFPPLRYTYLAPISLNVGSIQTRIAYSPSQDGSSLDAMSPEAPLQAVEQMIQDRLVAAGSGGTATVTINSASINRVGDTAVGNISLDLQVTSPDGRRTGYTSASVTRTRTLPDDTSDTAMRAFLYDMTSELVSAENVELEYQMRRHLGSWMLGGTSAVVGGPAAPTPVEAQPLGGPGSPMVGAPPSAAPMRLGSPMPLGSSGPASAPALMPVPNSGAAPSAIPSSGSMPVPLTPPTMPGADLGLPQGNPVQPDLGTPPATGYPSATYPATPTPTTAAPAAPSQSYQLTAPQPPAAVPPAPAPASTPTPAQSAPSSTTGSSGTLPPLPPTITP